MNALEELTESFSRLPGIGKKSASRISNYLLKADRGFMLRFAQQIAVLQDKIKPCSVCGSYTEEDPCAICSDPLRERNLLCVVEQPQDVQTIEASREFRGLFHVLGGVIAPLDGVGPEQLSIGKLMERLGDGSVTEVIIATNPTVEGDTTALYLQKLLAKTGVTVTRLASGLPVGGDLEYADRLTLARSFRGRAAF
ncbi:recombination mediator RecR [Treponema brennaborense]|uniref:Recombination protein RecR n=1 Tax=Treponema brennaborense (strain DSM 12168 / CIP 105900 / DD5/3) TaxID=906968 RepID=F4LMT1_TREBD|nr:recombination mediator RecR [Treponema brennaborense]AEE17821.1 Recombination protein recR [Treponema brennaborense DSM 12168]